MNPDIAISRELQTIAKEINDRLESVAGQPMGFTLIVFNATDGARVNYVSNCDRRDVAESMLELIGNWIDGMPDIKAHEVQ